MLQWICCRDESKCFGVEGVGLGEAEAYPVSRSGSSVLTGGYYEESEESLSVRMATADEMMSRKCEQLFTSRLFLCKVGRCISLTYQIHKKIEVM